MNYPADFTQEDIMEFEYEYNRYLDLQDPNSAESINAELQDLAYDALERDCDEPYQCEINDNWYDEQFEVDLD